MRSYIAHKTTMCSMQSIVSKAIYKVYYYAKLAMYIYHVYYTKLQVNYICIKLHKIAIALHYTTLHSLFYSYHSFKYKSRLYVKWIHKNLLISSIINTFTFKIRVDMVESVILLVSWFAPWFDDWWEKGELRLFTLAFNWLK